MGENLNAGYEITSEAEETQKPQTEKIVSEEIGVQGNIQGKLYQYTMKRLSTGQYFAENFEKGFAGEDVKPIEGNGSLSGTQKLVREHLEKILQKQKKQAALQAHVRLMV